MFYYLFLYIVFKRYSYACVSNELLLRPWLDSLIEICYTIFVGGNVLSCTWWNNIWSMADTVTLPLNLRRLLNKENTRMSFGWVPWTHMHEGTNLDWYYWIYMSYTIPSRGYIVLLIIIIKSGWEQIRS